MNLRTALHLGLITSLGSLMVLFISEFTEAARTENRRDALRSSWMELLQGDSSETFEFATRQLHEPVALCDQHGILQAAIIPGTASGYAGPIAFVMAVNRSGKVTGVRVTSHSETPGIGDVIEENKSDWIQTLSKRDAEATSWQLVRDGGEIDGVSGATITLRGLVRGLSKSLAQARPECPK